MINQDVLKVRAETLFEKKDPCIWASFDGGLRNEAAVATNGQVVFYQKKILEFSHFPLYKRTKPCYNNQALQQMHRWLNG